MPEIKTEIMAQKLWEKNVQVDHEVDIFTVGKDREMDLPISSFRGT